jgi:hypothetical protein
MTPGSLLEAAASRYGFSSVESLIQEVTPEVPGPTVQSIRDAIDRAAESFHETYGSEYGGRYDSFLVRRENVEAIIRSTFPGKAPLSAENLNGEGYEEAADAPIEVREEFVDLLHEEMMEDRRLTEILEKKRHRIAASRRWETLWRKIETIRQATEGENRFGKSVLEGPMDSYSQPAFSIEAAQNVDAEEVLDTYRSSLRDEVKEVRLFASDRSYPLHEVFFELAISEQAHQTRRGEKEWKPRIASKLQGVPRRQPGRTRRSQDARGRQDVPKRSDEPPATEKFDPEDLMEPGTRAQVIGPPGSGKSTLLQYLTLESLDDPDRLPVFLDLSTLPKGIKDKISDPEGFRSLLFEEGMATRLRRLPDPEGWSAEAEECLRGSLYSHLEKGTLDVYLDGLDEVSGRPSFAALKKRIKAFAQEQKETDNSVVVTMRPYAQTAPIPALSSMEVQPLTDEQIEAFVGAYYPDDDRMSELVDSIRKGAVGDVPRVPLLLSLITYLFRLDREIITNPLHLFRRAVDHLVTQLDHEKSADRFRVKDPKGRAKLTAFEELAYQGIFKETGDRVRHFVFTDDLLWDLAESEAPKYASTQDFHEDLLATPLLHPVGYKKYAFVHLTLQEYLAARHLSDKEDAIRRIVSSVFDPAQAALEILPMAMAMLSDPKLVYERLDELPKSLAHDGLRLMLRSQFYLEDPPEAVLEHLADSLSDIWRAAIRKQDPLHNHGFLNSLRDTTRPLHKRVKQNFIADLKTTRESERSRIVAKALGEIGGEEAAQALMDCLTAFETSRREAAAEALGEIGTEEAVPALIDCLTDSEESRGVRDAAAEALGEISTEEAVQALMGLLIKPGTKSKLHRAVARALGENGNEKALEALIGRLTDSEEWARVRRVAAETLGEIEDEKAAQALMDHLTDPVPEVREIAAEALGEIGTEEAVEALMDRLTDSNVESEVETSSFLLRQYAGSPTLEARPAFLPRPRACGPLRPCPPGR